jgi:hypothetical protein
MIGSATWGFSGKVSLGKKPGKSEKYSAIGRPERNPYRMQSRHRDPNPPGRRCLTPEFHQLTIGFVSKIIGLPNISNYAREFLAVLAMIAELSGAVDFLFTINPSRLTSWT